MLAFTQPAYCYTVQVRLACSKSISDIDAFAYLLVQGIVLMASRAMDTMEHLAPEDASKKPAVRLLRRVIVKRTCREC